MDEFVGGLKVVEDQRVVVEEGQEDFRADQTSLVTVICMGDVISEFWDGEMIVELNTREQTRV